MILLISITNDYQYFLFILFLIYFLSIYRFENIRILYYLYKNMDFIIISANHIKCQLGKCRIFTTMMWANSFITKTTLWSQNVWRWLIHLYRLLTYTVRWTYTRIVMLPNSNCYYFTIHSISNIYKTSSAKTS